MRRLLFRLAILALAGLGVWAIYQKFGDRLRRLGGPAQDFADRATDAARDAGHVFGDAGSRAVDAVTKAAGEMTDAASTAADKISDAASDAGHTAAGELAKD